MAPEPIRTTVPSTSVSTKVQILIEGDYTKIECVKQDDGKWTIKAS
jgi:hypothetical protein